LLLFLVELSTESLVELERKRLANAQKAMVRYATMLREQHVRLIVKNHDRNCDRDRDFTEISRGTFFCGGIPGKFLSGVIFFFF